MVIKSGPEAFQAGFFLWLFGALFFWLTRKKLHQAYFTNTWYAGVFPLPGLPGWAVVLMVLGSIFILKGIFLLFGIE